MKTQIFVLGACLAAAGCGAPAGEAGEEAISLEAGKEDRLGNRSIDTFGGAMHFDDAPHYVDLPEGGYKAGFTFRAVAGKEFKLSARVSGGKAPAILKLYGPKSDRNGNYPYVTTASTYLEKDDFGNQLTVSVVYYTPRAEGIYLAVLSTSRREGGVGEVHLNCGNADQCELGCAVIRLYDPQCGIDGVTYGNKPSAACFDVPIAYSGECKVIEPPPPGCELIDCGPNKICQMQEVVCITAPCDPVPTCVCSSIGLCVDGYKWSDETCQCEKADSCNQIGVCIQGWTWDPVACQCISPCATVRCPAGTHCESVGPTQCVPDQPSCVVSGCSGQICADQAMISTCEWLPEYACYATATCEVQSNGKCGWTQTVELTDCLGTR